MECCSASTMLVRVSILAVSCLIGSFWLFFAAASVLPPSSLPGSLWTWALLAVDGFVLVNGPSRRSLSFSSLVTFITCLRMASSVTLLSASSVFNSLRMSLHLWLKPWYTVCRNMSCTVAALYLRSESACFAAKSIFCFNPITRYKNCWGVSWSLCLVHINSWNSSVLLRSPRCDCRNPFNSLTVMSTLFISMSVKMPGIIILSTPLTISLSLKLSLIPASICLHTLWYVMSDEWSPIWPPCILNSRDWIHGSPPKGKAKSLVTCLGCSVLSICGVAAPPCTVGWVRSVCCVGVVMYWCIFLLSVSYSASILFMSVLILGSAPLTPLKSVEAWGGVRYVSFVVSVCSSVVSGCDTCVRWAFVSTLDVHISVQICFADFTVSCNDNSLLIPWSSISSKDSLDMKALMYSKQPSLSSKSSSDESLPCTGPMDLATWNSSSAGSVIRSFRMSHTKRFLVRAAMTLFSVVLSGTSLTSGWRQAVCPTLCVPRCHRWRSSRRPLAPASPGPTVLESLDQPPRVTWSRSRTSPQESVAGPAFRDPADRLLLPVKQEKCQKNERITSALSQLLCWSVY